MLSERFKYLQNLLMNQ